MFAADAWVFLYAKKTPKGQNPFARSEYAVVDRWVAGSLNNDRPPFSYVAQDEKRDRAPAAGAPFSRWQGFP